MEDKVNKMGTTTDEMNGKTDNITETVRSMGDDDDSNDESKARTLEEIKDDKDGKDWDMMRCGGRDE